MRIEPFGLKRVVAHAPAMSPSPEEDEKLENRTGGKIPVVAEFSDDVCSTSSSSTSSIGRNSDVSCDRSCVDDDDCGENEAQSSYNGPLDMMESLEEMLPIRRGISKFYNGKSKSFTSLAEASISGSVKDITKPENAYTRRRRNLMAFNQVWEKNRSLPLRSNSGGISKRSIGQSKSTLALAVAMNNYDSSSSCSSEDSNSRSPPTQSLLPPLHPRSRVAASDRAGASSPSIVQNFPASRSYSLADLHHCATAAKLDMSSSSLSNEVALNKLI